MGGSHWWLLREGKFHKICTIIRIRKNLGPLNKRAKVRMGSGDWEKMTGIDFSFNYEF